MRRFLISDTHFGHDAVYTFTDSNGDRIRPWATDSTTGDQVMIDRWNSIVAPEDKVYHLGDVAFPRKSLSILDKLNGKKVLIKGNHDMFDLKDYAKHFKDIRGAFEYKGFILTHVPVHPTQIGRFKGNIHGHLHSNVIDDPSYFNVSVERINATPILFEEVADILTTSVHHL